MTKMNWNFWIVLTALLLVSSAPYQAQAYLIPVIGGVAWLVVVLAGGVLVAAAFIWAHIIKFRRYVSRGKHIATTDTPASAPLDSDQTETHD